MADLCSVLQAPLFHSISISLDPVMYIFSVTGCIKLTNKITQHIYCHKMTIYGTSR